MKTSLLLAILLILSCSHQRSSPNETGWVRDNAKKVELYLHATKKSVPVAIFDWDNTVIKNDVGDAMMFWMLQQNLLKEPKSWKLSSRWLSTQALRDLDKNCHNKMSSLECQDTILSLYVDGKGWKENYNKETLEPAYAWLASLLSGMTADEVKLMAAQAIENNLSHPVGHKQKVGGREVAGYMRVYLPIKKLIHDLKQQGVDVWVVSASPQPIVETFAKYVDLNPDRVIGIRNTLDKFGRYTQNLQGCGSYQDQNQEIITYREGKRCWINKIIFGMKPFEQLGTRSPISFAAGDSDTDAVFLKDAMDFHLVINRHKPEVMCHALANQDGKWIINPMFIAPATLKTTQYDCSRYGIANQNDVE